MPSAAGVGRRAILIFRGSGWQALRRHLRMLYYPGSRPRVALANPAAFTASISEKNEAPYFVVGVPLRGQYCR